MSPARFKTKTETGLTHLVTVSCLISWMNASAEIKHFTVDPSQSSLAIVEGRVAGVVAAEQAAGSWTTSYSGAIAADVVAGATSVLIETARLSSSAVFFRLVPRL